LRAAFHLARPWHAQVTALSMRGDPRDVILLVGEAPSGRLVEEVMRAAEAEGARRLERDRALFARVGGSPEVATRFEDVVGADADAVAAFGRTADLIVAARPAESIGSREAVMLEAALFASGRPVLVPASSFAPALAERVVILWNDSVQAAHAVAAALPIAARAGGARIVVTDGAEVRASADRLVANLMRHGIPAEVDVCADGAPGALASKVTALGATLVVMGAWGHSRLRELVLGGATRHMLGQAGPALLMAH
jgi:nucleotide-binding universal stress UspA family protein